MASQQMASSEIDMGSPCKNTCILKHSAAFRANKKHFCAEWI